MRDIEQHDAVDAEAEQHRRRAGGRGRQRRAGEAEPAEHEHAATAPTAAIRPPRATGCGRRGRAAAESAPASRRCSRCSRASRPLRSRRAMRCPPANSTSQRRPRLVVAASAARRAPRDRARDVVEPRVERAREVGVVRRPRRAARSPDAPAVLRDVAARCHADVHAGLGAAERSRRRSNSPSGILPHELRRSPATVR